MKQEFTTGKAKVNIVFKQYDCILNNCQSVFAMSHVKILRDSFKFV
jgi:hypothetical protein